MKDQKHILRTYQKITNSIGIMLLVAVGVAALAISRSNSNLYFKIEVLLPHSLSFGMRVDSAFSWLMSKYQGDKIVPIILAFIPSLLSIAYPLFVQTISRLDDYYKSTHIIDKFKGEKIHKWFFRSLICSVVITLLSIIQINGIVWLDFALTVNLVIAFFFNINLLLKYQSGEDLFLLFRSRTKLEGSENLTPDMIKRSKARLLDSWYAVIDIYKYAIVSGDRKLQEDIRLFIRNCFYFIKYIEQKDKELVLFPDQLYNSSDDIIVTFLRNRDDFYHQNLDYYVGPTFYCEGGPRRQFIHPSTYAAIWRNLYSLVEHGRDEKIISYWESAHQHYRFNLTAPAPEYEKDLFEETEKSKENRKKTLEHGNTFLEFHTVLGAYLMHKRRFKTLYEVWFFTQSQPPEYPLIPQNTTLIFQIYFKFLNGSLFDHQFPLRFYFKDLWFDAMNDRPDVKKVVRKYCVVLFLKLWTTPDYFGQSSVVLPVIPRDKNKRQNWLSDLQTFKEDLQKILGDEDLLKALKLDKITKHNCKAKNVLYPIDFIDQLLKALTDGLEAALNESPLDEDLKKKLDDYTVKSLKEVYERLSKISGADVLKDQRDSVSDRMQVIRGPRRLLDKEAFLKDTTDSHIDFHKVIGWAIKNEYSSHVAIKFSTNVASNNRYEIPSGQLFKAIDLLKINPDNHVIVSFSHRFIFGTYEGVKIDIEVPNEIYRYQGIPIYCFDVDNPIIRNTFFILQKTSLPMIKLRDWSEIQDLSEEAKKYWSDLGAPIDNTLKIYRKFTELAKDKALLDEYARGGFYVGEQLTKMVEVNVDFLGYCWFRKGVKIVALKEGRIFQEGGLDILANIKEF